MPLKNYVDKQGPVVDAAWLNGVDELVTTVFENAVNKPTARIALTDDAPLETENGGTGTRSLDGEFFGKYIWPNTTQETVPPANHEYSPDHIGYDVRRAGVTMDGSTDDTVALIAAETVGSNLYVPRGRMRLTQDLVLTVPTTFDYLGKLAPDPGVSIKTGQVVAGSWQIFDLSATGSSVLGFKGTVVNAAWFGAVPDGKFDGTGTDSSQAIQNAINALDVGGGGAVFIPPGIYIIAKSLHVPSGVSVFGAGRWSSILVVPSTVLDTNVGVAIDGVGGYPTVWTGVSVLAQTGGVLGYGLVSTKNGTFISDIWVNGFTAHVGITLNQTDNFLFNFITEQNLIGLDVKQSHNTITNGEIFFNQASGMVIDNSAAAENGRVLVTDVRSCNDVVQGFLISAGKHVTIANCTAMDESNSFYTTAGIQVDVGTDVIITGFSGRLTTPSTTGMGILLSGGGSNIQISGGSCVGFRDGINTGSAVGVNISGGLHSGNTRHGVNIPGGDATLVTGVSANNNGSNGITINASAASSKLAAVGNLLSTNASFGIAATATASSFVNMVGNTANLNVAGGFSKTGTTANINDIGNF